MKALQAAVGEKWKENEPFVLVVGPNGTHIYQKNGKVDILTVRRYVLATIPNDKSYSGVTEYWNSVIKAGE
jgi:hypothetical protein